NLTVEVRPPDQVDQLVDKLGQAFLAGLGTPFFLPYTLLDKSTGWLLDAFDLASGLDVHTSSCVNGTVGWGAGVQASLQASICFDGGDVTVSFGAGVDIGAEVWFGGSLSASQELSWTTGIDHEMGDGTGVCASAEIELGIISDVDACYSPDEGDSTSSA